MMIRHVALLCILAPVVFGLFTTDMSRKAYDWIPVGICRAACLNVFGKSFGLTTLESCFQSDCGQCWDDCACQVFQPIPPWSVCTGSDACDQSPGCRLAALHVEKYGKVVANVSKNDSEWSLLVDGTMIDDNLLLINTTLLNDNRPYSSKSHLIFSVSYWSDDLWKQLVQEATLDFVVNLTMNAPECFPGCRMRIVVVSDDGVLAEAGFVHRSSVKLGMDYLIRNESDSAMSVDLILPHLGLWGAPQNGRSELKWMRIGQSAEESGISHICFNATNNSIIAFPKQLKYNSVYNITIDYQTDEYAVTYHLRLVTPDCQFPEQNFLICKPEPFADKLTQSSDQTTLIVVVVVVGLLLLGFAVLLFIWTVKTKNGKSSPTVSNLIDIESSPKGSTLPSPLRPNRVYASEDNFGGLGPIIPRNIPSDAIQREYCMTKSIDDIYFICEGMLGTLPVSAKRPVLGSHDKRTLEGIALELSILPKLKGHPNFIQFVCSSGKGPTSAVITKREEAFPLNDLLLCYRKAQRYCPRLNGLLLPLGKGFDFAPPFTAASMVDIANQIASGLAYLSTLNIVHGAVCTSNVLCDYSFRIKIHGFTNAVELDPTKKQSLRNILPKYFRWMPLEVLRYRTKGMGLPTDVWSFGVLVWELLTLGHVPYCTGDQQRLIKMLESGYVLEQPKTCSTEIYEVLLSCWKKKPSDRPTMIALHETISSMTNVIQHRIRLSEIATLELLADTKEAEMEDVLAVNDSVFESESIDDDVFLGSEESSSEKSRRTVSRMNLLTASTASQTTGSLKTRVVSVIRNSLESNSSLSGSA